ncbi:dynein heavy chain [Cladochytrium replicatum]|nr:dynein heavy chain [Cladochytrium replicatum]
MGDEDTTSELTPSSTTFGSVGAQPSDAIDPLTLKQYLEQLVPLLLNGVNAPPLSAELPKNGFASDVAAAFKSVDLEKLRRFITDATSTILLVAKSRVEETVTNGTNGSGHGEYMYTVHLEFAYNERHVASLALIKRFPVVEVTRSLQSQLQVMVLPGPADGANPYEILHMYIHHAVSPYFDAYTTAKTSAAGSNSEKSNKSGVTAAKKKIAELELSLQDLQQNVEIPQAILIPHPLVLATIEKCRKIGKKPTIDDLGDPLPFGEEELKDLQQDVSAWIRGVQRVTKMNREVSGPASQEINFWLSMERALSDIDEQLKSDVVLLTLDILKTAKRYYATISFLADIGLKEAVEKVQKYNQLMRDFPLSELLSATDVEKIKAAITRIFTHLNRKLKLSPYPIQRALLLVEAISRDLNDQLLKVFGSRRLMYVEYEEFEAIAEGCEQVFATWDQQVKDFTNVAREVMSKRQERRIVTKITPAHSKLQERIKFVREFRKQHWNLYNTILKVMSPQKGERAGVALGDKTADGDKWSSSFTEVNALEEVNLAYESVKTLDVLDVSQEGTELWLNAEKNYNNKVARVETQIINKLRDRLAIASSKNANEMFRVFSKFNALFVRPKIRGAIQEYQAQLIERVEQDIEKLKRMTSRQSEAPVLTQLRDIPPISGRIIWMRQIDRQLTHLMKRVEDVLGQGWEQYQDGQKLSTMCSALRKKVDARKIFDEWQQEISKRDLNVSGRVFNIGYSRVAGGVLSKSGAGGGLLVLEVRFDPQIIALFKEVRNLVWLNYTISYPIVSVAKNAKKVYPFAMSLIETVRMYQQTLARLSRNPAVAPLLAKYHKDVQMKISKGIQTKWEYFPNAYETVGTYADGRESRHVQFVREFAKSVTDFQDQLNDAMDVYDEIQKQVEKLRTCPYDRSVFVKILDKIQTHVDDLGFKYFSNLDSWTGTLDRQIEDILTVRVEAALKAWLSEFQQTEAQADRVERKRGKALGLQRRGTIISAGVTSGGEDATELLVPGEVTLGAPILEPLVHEVNIRNQVIYVDPPMEHARAQWYSQLHDWLASVCSLPRLSSTRYDQNLVQEELSIADATYSNVLLKVPKQLVQSAYDIIEGKIKNVANYVGIWLSYQSLWDLEFQAVTDSLGEELAKWQQLVYEIQKARKTFDNKETFKSFGNLVVDYGPVQAKVNTKYDQWQKEVLKSFGGKLHSAMLDLHERVKLARLNLEQQGVDGDSSTTGIIGFITYVEELNRAKESWQSEVEVFKGGQTQLKQQRYQFPPNWVDVAQIEGERTAFEQILSRKDKAIRDQLVGLKQKIQQEDKHVEQRIQDILNEWTTSKPVAGNVKPDAAQVILSQYEDRVVRLKEEFEQIQKAKTALRKYEARNEKKDDYKPGLEDLGEDERLDPMLEEIRGLKSVWSRVAATWKAVYEMKEQAWGTIVPRQIRSRLEALLEEMKDAPSSMRSYEAFLFAQETIRGYLKVNSLLMDLKSEALRERHWKQLFKVLKLDNKSNYGGDGSSSYMSVADLTLGLLWDTNLKAYEPAIKDVIVVAQGEMALEHFLEQVKDTWNNFSLDLVLYQNKVRLIRGWDELFTKCTENRSALTAMKHSPYFKVFQEDALLWEDKLNRVHVLFDVWIEVQRQWVYLEGIFTGSADIKHLLPVETARFQNINSEFLGIMSKVARTPLVMDVLGMSGIQKQMELLAEKLSKIQKALGEYLERERSSFPRFYFVGDEDLLEIIGNSKEVVRIQKHFKKMFAGIANILLNDDGSIINGIASREGEIIPFKNPVSIKDHPRINDWLTMLEKEMRTSLALWLSDSWDDLNSFYQDESLDSTRFLQWIDQFPAQLVVLAVQANWTAAVERALASYEKHPSSSALGKVLAQVERSLTVLADMVLTDLTPIRRKKCEHLITELVHQRDVIRALQRNGVNSPKHFDWLYQMRFYFNPAPENPVQRLTVHMANAVFPYGFEYLGVPERLVQTPLTDRCYLTLTQALDNRLGGSPFGPAGTGKTESVKALGVQLGRFVLVFCCDENFDFQAMGRIFIGLCRVGAWGCFDEFNRLEERILSAVSQQVQTIQLGLKSAEEIELVGKPLTVNPDTGIFITMNPGYAGRSNLPDNLKKLFRNVAMTKPDRELIAQVMLYSQGFRTAELLASKVVPLFNLCEEQLSPQSHYDFGLRSLKSVLVSAGNLKRERLQAIRDTEAGTDLSDISDSTTEQKIVIQSVRETVSPKLVANDILLLQSLLADVFPGVVYEPVSLDRLREEIRKVCAERRLVDGEFWMEKVIQLYQIQNIHHGLMMVGPSGSGKSQAWRVLLKALENVENIEGTAYVIDPKAMSKESLYGAMDPTTREWTDGLFTNILRKIVDNVRGEAQRRHWIIFDGDVDPEWVENLNSVLDDNRLLTLPNGERLSLPPNVRIMFEVENLKYATLATVSRCGMVWFSEDVVSLSMIFDHYLNKLRNVALDENPEDGTRDQRANVDATELISRTLHTQRIAADTIAPFFEPEGLVVKALDYARDIEHIMDLTRMRVLDTLFSLINKTVRNVLDYNLTHPDFPMDAEVQERYISKRMVISIIWSFSGDAKLDSRRALGEFIRQSSSLDLPPVKTSGESIIDYDVDLATGDWTPWHKKVPKIEIDPQRVASAGDVIPTIDTVRHEEILHSWLSEHKPLILCGPPGSGKTMTLFSVLRSLPDFEVVGLNFSSATTPELILKTFEQYCEYRKTPNGVVLAPQTMNRWLVVFCDEINLPATDKYGTQRVVSFLRQLVEHGGYWRTSDKAWVRLERMQFVGACNPPTDPGRVPMSHRFLRHSPLIMVDYPGELSLMQIYSTFSRAMLMLVHNLRGHAEALTSAMVEFYIMSQKRFTPDIQAHYIYSPRELTRWVRGIYEAIKPMESLNLEDLVRIWAHECLRLFQDRLVTEEERRWTDENLDMIAMKYFPTINRDEALARPILFSNWTSKNYVPVDREQLRDFVRARLKVFYEEELDTPLVLFNDVLDHVLRIDRAFRQVQGHLLLIGVSGSGKTTLSRFVAWMNGLSVFQIKVHNKYTAADFDDDLRKVLRRAGCKGEKIAFIMDESNVLDSGFLERMNTLLANGEVPGLFEGDDYSSLMTQCKDGAQREGSTMVDSPEDLYRWFTQQVMKNLHVVFTMNPPEGGLASRAATSPALFNRCVLDWFGDWSDQAFYQVGKEFTDSLDLDNALYIPPNNFPIAYMDLPLPPTYRNAVINAFVHVHQSLYDINARVAKRQGRYMTVTPRHYLDFINHYERLFVEKRADLEEQQRHLNVGLDKLKVTVVKVEELRVSLGVKGAEIRAKEQEAKEKLEKMLADKQVATETQKASMELKERLAKQTVEIEERRKIVIADLANAEPAVEEAQRSVSGIKKQHLTEVRAMGNPPEAVKIAMESVCALLGHKIDSWKAVQGVIRRDDFIANIVNYDTNKMSKKMRDEVMTKYIADPNFNFEAVNRASKACGPLVQWVIAQVKYSEIIEKVGPLREEVSSLESEANLSKVKAEELDTMIEQLTVKIQQYEEDYAKLISDKEALKAERDMVKRRVDRSETLLRNLSSEKTRWEMASESFEVQIGTIVGDVLLSAAFISYAGYFDQQYRDILLQKWMGHLTAAGIKFKQDISLPEYLSTADERLEWQANSLPADDLCTENAVMLKRYNRYPLIIDPSGQATTYLLNEYRNRKIAVTSFVDDSFLKVLESALRFGSPLLVQDVEHLDPILNAVLNKELRRTGGRTLIRLGNQEIDFSPTFTLFLSTRDPSVQFPPDICSRVTFVNFTVTRSSLQSQCLHAVLKAERPDTDKKRTDMLKLQGEFQLKLRHLEKSLLQSLNESRGNILDDDKVISNLETLKKEAEEVTMKMRTTDQVMQEVDRVTAMYTPLAQSCSSIFFILEQLGMLHHFYQFSLDFFLQIFEFVLHQNPALPALPANASGVDYAGRLAILSRDVFKVAYQRASRSLLHEDHLTLAILLANIKTRGTTDQIDEQENDFLMHGGDAVGRAKKGLESGGDKSFAAILGEDASTRVVALSGTISIFGSLLNHIAENQSQWKAFVEHSEPETVVPKCWTSAVNESAVITAFRNLIIIRCTRPDRLGAAGALFVEAVFGPGFVSASEHPIKSIVYDEVDCTTPLAFCSIPGYDASYRVENFASEAGSRLISVAMGSAEGFKQASDAISNAAKSGGYVLLKNVHLAPSWLGSLEKRLHGLKPHSNFRLFLTMETNPKVPVNLLRQSRVLMFEPPPGLKANLQETLRSIPASRLIKGPNERIRLYFLLAWLHSIVQERLRYVPLGWTKFYEFNDSDHDMAIVTIDNWVDNIAQGRNNISPDKIPWGAIKTLVKETIYGGKIDSDVDQSLLNSFVDRLFSPASFDLGFALVDESSSKDEDGASSKLLVPDCIKMEQFLEWVGKLPDRQPPSWLGLPNNAEKVLLASRGVEMISKVRRMRSLADDDEVVYTEDSKGKKNDGAGNQPAWMRSLQTIANDWLSQLPEKIFAMNKTAESMRDPLFRFFERENQIGQELLAQVRLDLTDLKLVCEGKLKQTNHLRSLMNYLNKAMVPQHWIRYKVPKNTSVHQWLGDFRERLQQLDRVSRLSTFNHIEIWIGGLFIPEAFITATRQAVAQAHHWSLEELALSVSISETAEADSFAVSGTKLEGGVWENGRIELSNILLSTKLPIMRIRWLRDADNAAPTRTSRISIPMYLNKDRTDLLMMAKLQAGTSQEQLIQRGVAIVAGSF